MKYNILSSILILLLSLNVNGQEIKIFQNEIAYEESNYPAFSIYLTPSTKAVKKQLKNYIDDQYNVKLKGIGFLTNKDVLSANEARIDGISPKKIDFYAQVIEEDDQTKLSFFGAYGYDIFLDPNVDLQAYYNLRKVMVGFLNDYLPGYYTDQVEDAAEIVEDLKDEKTDLKDDIADNKDDIQEKLKEIESLRKENAELFKKLEDTNGKLITNETELTKTKTELNKVNVQLKELKKNQ